MTASDIIDILGLARREAEVRRRVVQALGRGDACQATCRQHEVIVLGEIEAAITQLIRRQGTLTRILVAVLETARAEAARAEAARSARADLPAIWDGAADADELVGELPPDHVPCRSPLLGGDTPPSPHR